MIYNFGFLLYSKATVIPIDMFFFIFFSIIIYHRILKIVPCTVWGFPNGSVVKNPPAMQETQVWSLGQEDPLEEEEMATHSSILAWKIPRTEEPGVLRSMGLQKVRHDWVTEHTYTLYCRTLLFIHSIYNGLHLLIPSHHSWISLVRACDCTCKPDLGGNIPAVLWELGQVTWPLWASFSLSV